MRKEKSHLQEEFGSEQGDFNAAKIFDILLQKDNEQEQNKETETRANNPKRK